MKTLFNPFEKYTENRLLVVGLLATLVGSALAYFLFARFDGILDLHFVAEVEWWQPLLDNGINILTAAILLYVAGKALNRKPRFIDILAVSIISRIPYYLLPLFNINNYMYKATTSLVDPVPKQLNPISGNITILLVFGLFAFLAAAWYITLLYNGYRIAGNAKGTKAVLIFIASILLTEFLSKFLIYQIS